MEDNLVWLRASLFCCTSNWGKLFQDGILSFIKSDEAKFVKNYTIELNYLSGTNIRFSLLTEYENALSTAQSLHVFFNDFFKGANLDDNKAAFPVDGIFMPFPSNSIQFGLFEQTLSDQIDIEFEQELSKVLLVALSQAEVTGETIFTLGFYLNTTAVKVLSSYYHIPSLTETTTYAVEKDIVEGYNFASNCLVEVTHSIFEMTSFDEDLQWLKDWEEICKEKIATLVQSEETLNSAYSHIENKVGNKLSMKGKPRATLNYYIHQSLNLYHGEIRA